MSSWSELGSLLSIFTENAIRNLSKEFFFNIKFRKFYDKVGSELDYFYCSYIAWYLFNFFHDFFFARNNVLTLMIKKEKKILKSCKQIHARMSYIVPSRCVSFDKSIGAAIDARLTTDGGKVFCASFMRLSLMDVSKCGCCIAILTRNSNSLDVDNPRGHSVYIPADTIIRTLLISLFFVSNILEIDNAQFG